MMSCDGSDTTVNKKLAEGSYPAGREYLPVFLGVLQMEYIAEIYSLSAQFYQDYSPAQYPEILRKKDRPYTCLLVEYMDEIYLCIPFRSQIRHPYAFHFKHSARAKQMQSGLDYTKTVLIVRDEYIDSLHPAVVDRDEFLETIQNLPRIVKEIYRFIGEYQDDLNGVRPLHPREWQRRYGRSSIPYFNSLLQQPRP